MRQKERAYSNWRRMNHIRGLHRQRHLLQKRKRKTSLAQQPARTKTQHVTETMVVKTAFVSCRVRAYTVSHTNFCARILFMRVCNDMCICVLNHMMSSFFFLVLFLFFCKDGIGNVETETQLGACLLTNLF